MKVITLNPMGGGNRLTPEQCEDLAMGRALLRTLYVRGGETPQSFRLNSRERVEYEAAKKRGYYFDKPSKVHTLASRWLEYHNQPFTCIASKSKFSTLTMDLISVPRVSSAKWEATPIQEPPAAIGGRVAYWGAYTVIKKISRENATTCAEWLLALFRSIT